MKTKLPMMTWAVPLFYSIVWSGWENITPFVRYRRGVIMLIFFTHDFLTNFDLFATITDSAFAYKHKNLVYLKERES